ncbi:guanine nucleotide-binding protein-like 1 [Planococcus citri]|uniref:guanine nucleotide-binding protein-like 1 n=1 Tax=Planococcus citri TaxID=170843 RepID=UPI0031F746A1
MPQGRRKVPFSAKQKKLQLQAKRHKKQGLLEHQSDDSERSRDQPRVQKINQQPTTAAGKSNRYALQFFKETNEEIQQRKEQARQAIVPVTEEELEIDIDNYFLPELDFPKRPLWDYEMTKEEIDLQENRYFREYLAGIEKQFPLKDLSYFELNLETWRQLWRVIEMSDIILIIVDIRFSALMFPPSLYKFVVEDLKKEMILVLNKIDLAPAELVVAWKYYFLSKFPSIHILTFTSVPGYNLHGNVESKMNAKRKARMRMSFEGAQKLQELCDKIVGSEVDLSSWKKKIIEEKSKEYDNEELEVEQSTEITSIDTSYHKHQKFRDGVLTIGCIGQPNVGKSSLMNAIIGKKVVSVSKTPGHTKHFQTIFLTPTVKVCDCPGLVFPSKVPKVLQVLMGSFPIAQLREPYTSVKYIAERIDLVKLLHLQHPNDDEEWSSMDICDGWAKKRGFLTARAARLDSYRAANHLLRLALDGKICLCLRPAGYSTKIEHWKTHPEIQEVLWIQAKNKSEESQLRGNIESDEDESDSCRSSGDSGETDSGEDSDESDVESTGDFSSASTNKFAALGEVE